MTFVKNAVDTEWQTNVTTAEANSHQRFNLYRSLRILGKNVKSTVRRNSLRYGSNAPETAAYYPRAQQQQDQLAGLFRN